MSAPLAAGDFESLEAPLTLELKVGEVATRVALEVKSVDPLPPHRFREHPFSVVFTGPRSPALAQGTYAIDHPRLGVLEVFLVPIGQDPSSTRYEATFN